MAVTLADLRNEILLYTADFINATTDNLNKQIKFTRNHMARNVDISFLLFTDVINTTNGVSSYSLPTLFRDEYYVYNTTLNKIIELWLPDVVLDEKVIYGLPSSGEPRGYQIRNNKIIFYPTPDNDYTIEILSYHLPTVLTNDIDTDALNDNYEECIVKGATYRLFSQVGSFDLATIYYNEYKELLLEVSNQEKNRWQQKLLAYKRRLAEKLNVANIDIL